jgi:hypothetical protein
VEVVNKAAIRLLAWKLWSKSTVTYEISSSSSGSSALPRAAAGQQQGVSSGVSTQEQQETEQRVAFELVSSVSTHS